MTAASPRMTLAVALQTFAAAPDEIQSRQTAIHGEVLAQSRYIHGPNFTSIHTADLELLFQAYDRIFLECSCREALQGRSLGFRLSRRMVLSGGTTTHFLSKLGVSSYEIAIGAGVLFDGFVATDGAPPPRPIKVCGLECADRLQALQRIFEHELIHLAENLVWGSSECAAPRFQDIARRLFLHRSHKHELITRREHAAQSGIRVGTSVTFDFEGQRLEGRVNRITRRATVLVQHPEGVQYSDGHRYRKFYVPLKNLEPL